MENGTKRRNFAQITARPRSRIVAHAVSGRQKPFPARRRSRLKKTMKEPSGTQVPLEERPDISRRKGMSFTNQPKGPEVKNQPGHGTGRPCFPLNVSLDLSGGLLQGKLEKKNFTGKKNWHDSASSSLTARVGLYPSKDVVVGGKGVSKI